MPTAQFPAEYQPALADVVDALDVGVIIVDRDLVIRGWNRWMESASGRDANSVIGQPLHAVFPNTRATIIDALKTAVNGKPMFLSHSLHRYAFELPPSGEMGFEQMQQTVRFTPLPQVDGEPCGAIAFVQDVTERVARERDLREATERAELANESKANFLTTMSHELRTPIGAMTSYVDLVVTGVYGPVTDEQRKHLTRVKTVGGHLLNIVEGILQFARVEAGREELRLGPADAFEIAREALAVIHPMASEKGLEVKSDIPDGAAPLTTDAVKLRQILINLLGNSIKFTERGTVSLSVRVEANRAVFVVSDTGVGIAPADLDRVFEPFVQIDGPHHRTQTGTGLGLAVSRHLARMLGGDVTAESRLGEGSSFRASVLSVPAP
jgi:PAS domain S-box-containing protein